MVIELLLLILVSFILSLSLSPSLSLLLFCVILILEGRADCKKEKNRVWKNWNRDLL